MYLHIQRAELTVDRQDAVDECHPATAEAVADEVKEQYGSTYAQSLTFGAIKHQITSVGATVLTGFSMVPRNVVQQIYHGRDDVAQVKLTSLQVGESHLHRWEGLCDVRAFHPYHCKKTAVPYEITVCDRLTIAYPDRRPKGQAGDADRALVHPADNVFNAYLTRGRSASLAYLRS